MKTCKNVLFNYKQKPNLRLHIKRRFGFCLDDVKKEKFLNIKEVRAAQNVGKDESTEEKRKIKDELNKLTVNKNKHKMQEIIQKISFLLWV